MMSKALLEKLNGVAQWGLIGEYRIRNEEDRKGFMRAPFLKTTPGNVRPDCPKVIFCYDQVFSLNIQGDVHECFRYCYEYQDMPGHVLQPPARTGDEGGSIHIQLPINVSLRGVKFSAFRAIGPYKAPFYPEEGGKSLHGQIQVCVGSEVEENAALLLNLVVDEDGKRRGETISFPHNAIRQLGNIITIEVGPNTEVPYFMFASNVKGDFQTEAMPDQLLPVLTEAIDISGMVASQRDTEQEADQIHFGRTSPFPTCIHKASMDKMLFKEGLRVNPAFGHPDWTGAYFMDDILSLCYKEKATSIVKLADWPTQFKGKTQNIMNVAKEFAIRYGRNANVAEKLRPIDTATPHIRNGVKHYNKIYMGMRLISGLHVSGIFSDNPFEFGAQQKALHETIKEIDKLLLVGMSLPADRNFIYLATQNMRTVHKKQYMDYLVIRFTSYAELEKMYEIFALCVSYFLRVPIFVELDFDFDWREYPAMLYICSLWNINKVILNGYDDMIRRDGIGENFSNFRKWYSLAKSTRVFRLNIFENTVNATIVGDSTGAYKFYLCRGINSGNQVITYGGDEVNMPLVCHSRNIQKRRIEPSFHSTRSPKVVRTATPPSGSGIEGEPDIREDKRVGRLDASDTRGPVKRR